MGLEPSTTLNPDAVYLLTCTDWRHLDLYSTLKTNLFHSVVKSVVSCSRMCQAATCHSLAFLVFITWRKAVRAFTDYTVAALTSAVFIIMADTQQKINRVVVDLIKVISPRSCLMPCKRTGLISLLILSFSTVQFVAKMQEGSMHEPLKLSKEDRKREWWRLYFRIWMKQKFG